jgi:hypothetical protein
MDGTGTAYTDLKGNTVTAIGVATQSATTSKFGGRSHYNGNQDSGTGLQLSALTTPTLLAYNGDFTVECWTYLTGDTEYSFNSIISRTLTGDRPSPVSSSLEIGIYNISGMFRPWCNVYNTSTGGFAPGGNLPISINTWNHIALCRNNNVLRLWVNGALSVTSGTITGTVSIPSATVQIGMTQNRHSFRGYIDDVRVIHGLGLYTAPFAPTAPFPNS